MITRPTQELINLGYDHSKMLFYKDTGDVSQEVWDVLLYQLLGECNTSDQKTFYQAHMNGDSNTKANFHQMYRREVCDGLLQHVHTMLDELAGCATRISQGMGPTNPNLQMIQQHNDFVRETFLKVRSNLESIKASA